MLKPNHHLTKVSFLHPKFLKIKKKTRSHNNSHVGCVTTNVKQQKFATNNSINFSSNHSLRNPLVDVTLCCGWPKRGDKKPRIDFPLEFILIKLHKPWKLWSFIRAVVVNNNKKKVGHAMLIKLTWIISCGLNKVFFFKRKRHKRCLKLWNFFCDGKSSKEIANFYFRILHFIFAF